jgi:hypothetical protein
METPWFRKSKYVQLIKEGNTFTAAMGGRKPLRDILEKIDLDTLSRQLRRELEQTSSEAQRTKLSKRLKVVAVHSRPAPRTRP